MLQSRARRSILLHFFLLWTFAVQADGRPQTRNWPSWWRVAPDTHWRTHENGTLKLEPSIRRVYVDVGAHYRTQFLTQLQDSPDLFVICFEPLVDLGGGYVDHKRLLMIPAAVSSQAAHSFDAAGARKVIFFAYSGLGTYFSSLLPVRENYVELLRAEVQLQAPKKFLVSAVTLEDAFKRLPVGLPVELLKIDAQGSDLDVALSAGPELQRVMRMQLECQDLPANDYLLIYEGSHTKASAVAALKAKGFVLERCWENYPWVREENCIFAKKSIALKVFDNCFYQRAGFPENLLQMVAFMNPAVHAALNRTRRAKQFNEAKVLELYCCRNRGKWDMCFDYVHTFEKCCLRAYLSAINYGHEIGSKEVALQASWTPKRKEVHLVWNVDNEAEAL